MNKFEYSQGNHDFMFGNKPFFLIAGPCVVESAELIEETSTEIKRICDHLGIPLIFKSSYRKANRSSLDSFTGIGDLQALEILHKVRDSLNVPVITDVHSIDEVEIASSYIDVIQIPAFLCRQTDLIVAAAMSGKPVLIKKGQFMSPESMHFAIEKVRRSGNNNVGIIERGNSFGYQDLVVDFRGINAMQKFEVPVIMDCTHALQKPNQASGVTGGQVEYVATLAKAATAVGGNGLFIETHPDPANAKSDGSNMLPLDQLEALLKTVLKIRKAID